MTLNDIVTYPKETLTCKQVAAILGYGEYQLHQIAVNYPERLPFPVIVIGNRVKIPKKAFLSFMEGAQINYAKTKN